MAAATQATYVNTTQVAKALGLSVSTVKRWVDDGVLPAIKTAGGHRKLLLADVLELVRRGDLAQADLSYLVEPEGGRGGVRAPAPGRLREDLHAALRSGDAEQTRALLHGAFRRGLAIDVLGDQVIGPAMERIGQDWEKGRIDVMVEHRASEICAAALYELKGILERRATRDRPRAVGGAPPRDYSILPSLLAQMVLLDAGWEAINLGANTPFVSFVKALRDMRPRLLWLSACHLDDEETFVAGYRDLYLQAEKAGIPVAIGGRCLAGPLRARIPYTTYGDGLSHLAAFARTLHHRPPPPRRGRPRKA